MDRDCDLLQVDLHYKLWLGNAVLCVTIAETSIIPSSIVPSCAHTHQRIKEYSISEGQNSVFLRSVTDSKNLCIGQYDKFLRSIVFTVLVMPDIIAILTDILPGLSPYWLSPIISFHRIGYPRYYRDILESVTHLTSFQYPLRNS